MAVAIFGIVLEMLFVEEQPNPEPKGFVVASMWLNFVLMILLTIQTLWPILILACELCKEFGATVLVKLGIWTDLKYLDRVIETALNPVSKLAGRLGTRKRRQDTRRLRIAVQVEIVRKNLMRGVEQRRAAKRQARSAPEMLAHQRSMTSFDAGAVTGASNGEDEEEISSSVSSASVESVFLFWM